MGVSMKRRDFFKMFGALAGAAVVAPLLKLLPETEPTGAMPLSAIRSFPVGQPITIRYPQRWVLSEPELKARYIEPAIKALFEAGELGREIAKEHAADNAFLEGESWQS